MAVKMDGWKRLQENLAENEKEWQLFYERCTKELAARLLAKVIKRTPVGKKPEHLTSVKKKTVRVTGASGKSRTFFTKESAILKYYWEGYQGGALRRGWTGGVTQKPDEYLNGIKVTKSGNQYIIEIINPVEYASYVEFGHRQTPGRYVPALGLKLKKSWVPGKHMLTISEKEVQKIAPALLEKRIQEALRSVFDGK